jgi:AAA ATPase domain
MAYQVTAGRFVGRTQELARLGELLARAADGTPLLALLGGEAGIGKTRPAAVLTGARTLAAIAEWAADAPPMIRAALGADARRPTGSRCRLRPPSAAPWPAWTATP